MGADYFASDDGSFCMVFRDSQGNVIGVVSNTDLEPEEPIYAEIAKGRPR